MRMREPSGRRTQSRVAASRTLTASAEPSGESAGYSNDPSHSGAYGCSVPSRATQTSVDFARSTVPTM